LQSDKIARRQRLNLITIIPAKPFTEAKTRLKAILSTAERARLSRFLLTRTIQLATTIGDVVIVSRSAAVRRAAKSAGAWALVETEPDLNAAIAQGIEWASRKNAGAVLILPLDLPTLTATDLQTLVAQGTTSAPALVIAPCHRQQGTNALLLRPPTLIQPQFGKNSFSRHLVAARASDVVPQIIHMPGLAFDLDTPQDWRQFLSAAQNLSDNLTNSAIFDLLHAF